MNFRRNAV